MAPRLTLFTGVFLLAVFVTVGLLYSAHHTTRGTGDYVSPYERRTLVRGADATHLSHAAPKDKLASLERAIASLHRDVKMVQRDIAEAGRIGRMREQNEAVQAKIDEQEREVQRIERENTATENS